MKNIVDRLKKEFSQTSDLIIKEIEISSLKKVYVLYLESISGGDRVHDYILKNLSRVKLQGNLFIPDLNTLLPSPNTVKIQEEDRVEFYITNGFTIVTDKKEIFAVETKANLNRSIEKPSVQQGIYGPKDSFNENIQDNLGLVKRRIKSSTLKTVDLFLGRKTNTKVQILYLEDITDDSLVKKIKNKLAKIDTDGILDTGVIAQYLADENKTAMPTISSTERPDAICTALLEGKVAILADTSPFGLIVPGFFADFINPINDNYNKNSSINFMKILRFLCFFFTMIIPAFYIALVNFNQESIPTTLLVNFSMQSDSVPFPTLVEALLMLFLCEILRESDIRFPNSYGSAISILGALIIGEAAVEAGVVSPIMIIVVAFTFITSLIFTELEMVHAIRHFRFLFVIAASLYGLYGVVLAFVYFLIRMNEIDLFGYPYFYPISPFDKTYMSKTLFRGKVNKDEKRSKLLASKNQIKQKVMP